MKLTYKEVDQKWTIWDCPDKPFKHNHEFFRVAIELVPFNETDTHFPLIILPSYTLTLDQQSQFTCVYQVEYEIHPHGEILTGETLSKIILEDCFPVFTVAFDKQKLEFEAAQLLPAPALNPSIESVVREGAAKALKDQGYTS